MGSATVPALAVLVVSLVTLEPVRAINDFKALLLTAAAKSTELDNKPNELTWGNLPEIVGDSTRFSFHGEMIRAFRRAGNVPAEGEQHAAMVLFEFHGRRIMDNIIKAAGLSDYGPGGVGQIYKDDKGVSVPGLVDDVMYAARRYGKVRLVKAIDDYIISGVAIKGEQDVPPGKPLEVKMISRKSNDVTL